SLGCTMYYLLVGRPPFQDASATKVLLKHQNEQLMPVGNMRRDVPDGVQAVLLKLLGKRPEERYQVPAEVALALKPYVSGILLPPGPAKKFSGFSLASSSSVRPQAGSQTPPSPFNFSGSSVSGGQESMRKDYTWWRFFSPTF